MEPYDFALQKVTEAGEILIRARDKGFKMMIKGGNPKDIVTSVDHKVNDFLIAEIKKAFPSHRIYSEEGGGSDVDGNEQWIVDPIDGSANFSRGIPHFSVCLGLLEGREPIVGAVYNPVTKELFNFKKGGGAFLNGETISVSKTTDLKEASVFLHAGRKPELWSWGGTSYTKLLGVAKKISNYGGSALDTCFVASGRIEANIYGHLTTIDIAAAIGILLEAGGRVVNDKGEPIAFSTEPQKVVMSNNSEIEKTILKLIF